MFVAIDQVFTLENILYLAKGALLSVAIAALLPFNWFSIRNLRRKRKKKQTQGA